jgi:hypothetical protein
MTAPTALRLKLKAAGFAPLPLQGKVPAPKAWQEKIDCNHNEIASWEWSFLRAASTGILTKFVPTIDIDILNPEAAEAVEALARKRFEERGHVLVRIGQPPKRAILLRTIEPFKKIVGNVTAPDGSAQRIELLGDGQQVVVCGIHPSTGKPYRWHGGEPGERKSEELPDVSADEAQAFVDDAVALLVKEHGYKATAPQPKGNGQDGGHALDPKMQREAGKGTIIEPPSEWTELNTAALQNPSAWVPALLPAAVPYKDGYRVSSKALGRDLQEDLSITPQGIKDFGVHDMGDPREGRRSPIDFVIEHGHKEFGEAVDWLRRRLGLPAFDKGVSLDDFFRVHAAAHLHLHTDTRTMAGVQRRRPARYGPALQLGWDTLAR